ncbi:matrixin family metalloprotease [Polyangium aurulentum]|uniref:matrixin family metalloprotease n=1 Tax=Polyangium aurulentum TaxID=2567896 RepID=UPI0010ADD9EF|nr:matrixin family metalloprotease [Polyangium aurulentum]UQA62528.1 matrixin family metalloprotease [Polyangium aurulentum]
MNTTLRSSLRLALVLAPLSAASALVACAPEGASDLMDGAQADAVEAGAPVLAFGDSGEDVRWVYGYLRQYGYFANEALAHHYPGWKPAASREPADPEVFDEAIEEGVMLFQKAYGLPITGAVDEATLAAMQKPRCSFPDFYTSADAAAGSHNFTLHGSKWSKTALTYRFANYTSDLSQASIRNAVSEALFDWSASSPLTFSEVSSGEDITIGWYTGSHCSASAFDGSNGVLAHAFFPSSGGDVHFDDAESWSTSSSSGIHLETVAVHELGHSLGLAHSSVSGSIMYPTYSGVNDAPRDDDRAGIWAIYGAFSAPSPGGDIHAGQGLSAGQSMSSYDGRFQLVMQSDGNLVLYKLTNGSVTPLWATGTNSAMPDRMIMQEDGNLVLYKSSGAPVWATGTSSTANRYSRLVVQNDGNLVIYNQSGSPVWASNTCCH